MGRLRLGVVGVGHLGKEHARILAGLPDVELVGVADVNAEQAEAVARRHASRAYRDYRQLLPLVDAAVIAVPTSLHHSIAAEFLRRGLPLLVEKPLAATLAEADDLVELARRHGAMLQVGHIERFNPAFEELARRPLQPKLITCERHGPFTGRSTDIGVVLDLMIHDLDLVLALVRGSVRTVQAVGVSALGGHEDVAHAHLVFDEGCVVTLSASRVSPLAARRMQVWGPEGAASLDFARRRLTLMQPSEQVRQDGLDLRRLAPAQRATLREEFFCRYLHVLELDRNQGDQLTRELQHFSHCVRTGEAPLVSGEAGRDAIALASRILDSLRTHSWLSRAAGPLFRVAEGQAAA